MKKLVAVLLCVVMLFSFAAVFAFAEDEPAVETVTVTFLDDDGTVIKTEVVEKGQAPVFPANPTKPRDDGDPEYEFKCWVDENDNEYNRNTLTGVNADMTLTAKYVKKYDDPDNITIMSFLASIFQRLNKIFAQISTYLEELTKSVQKLIG